MLNSKSNNSSLIKVIGPGLLFASTAIGTSHLVLSTRAGAHHGMIYLWIILAALLLKYPFFEFGPRYASATGNSLLKGYKDQGTWVLVVFMCIISLNMFAITGAIAAVTAGLLSTMLGITNISVQILAGLILGCSVLLLLFGGYKGLDRLIKIISIILLLCLCIAFIAVIIKGKTSPDPSITVRPILKGAGLTLLISLLGWMPSGMEASTMSSIWTIEKAKATNYTPNLRESLFDFNLGYIFTTVLAIMFMTIGAYTVYGTGNILDGNATVFSNKLLKIFVSNVGEWSYFIIAIAAIGTIYGTLITVLDAFPRCLVRGVRILRFGEIENNEIQNNFLKRLYHIILIGLGIGSFCLFYFSATSMLQLLQFVTILSFIYSPFIAYINLKAVQSQSIPDSHKPSKFLLSLAYLGMVLLIVFAAYYLSTLV
jgi:Mn2+/Fe2+ NRAMP family transporter